MHGGHGMTNRPTDWHVLDLDAAQNSPFTLFWSRED